MVFAFFLWEAADDISSESHMGHGALEEVANFIELFNSIFSVHLIEHVIRTTLHWNMQELVHTWVVHNVSHRL